jgi:type I restriction enzyme S subunit
MKDVSLSNLCDLAATQVDPADNTSLPYVGLEHVTPGRFAVSAWGKASDVSSSKFLFKRDDILYGKLRPYLDKAVIAQGDGLCTTEFLVLRPKVGVDARFLAAVVHSQQFIEHAMAGVTGAHHPRTSWSHLREFAIPEFDPPTQTKIGAIAATAQEAITACEITLDSTSALKRAAMREVFTRGLRGREQKETEIGLIPASWNVVALGTLGPIGNGSTPKRSVREYWDGGTYPWLTSAKVYDREIVAADQFVTETALSECHLPKVRPGSVLMAITGQGKTLGHCAVLKCEATINQHIAYMAVSPEVADPSYVRGYLETKYDFLRQVGSGGGSTKGALTCAFLKTLPIPLPPGPDLDEQREIVAILDAIDQKIDLHKTKKAVLEEMFRAMLRELMTGEICLTDFDLSALDAPAAAEGSL